jgi:hypothetical protein
MRESSYIDPKGRKWAVLLPEGVPDSDASMGVHLGPPSLESLGLPEEQEVRLHNQLFNRRIYTKQDARKRRQDIIGALFATFKVDAQRIVDLYEEEKSEPIPQRPRRQPQVEKKVKAARRGGKKT